MRDSGNISDRIRGNIYLTQITLKVRSFLSLIKFLDKKPLCSVWTERFFQSPHGVKAAITVSAETNPFDEFQSP